MKKFINNIFIINFICNIFQRKKTNTNKKEFSFVWYKKMINKDHIYYTKPFRTKIIAKNKEEAQEKLMDFIHSKMLLIIHTENEFNKTDISEIQRYFDQICNQMNEIFKKFENGKR